MDPLTAFWHVCNFFAAPVLTGAIAAALAKLFWRRQLAGVAWWRLAAWCAWAMALATVGGLLVFAQDGRMATYAAMVGAGAAALWWRGFRRHA